MWNSPRGLILSSLCLISVMWGLLETLTPATELVRLRNSLVATSGSPADFSWTPANRPADYRQETSEAPGPIQEWARSLPPASDTVEVAEAIVRHLRQRPKRKGPIKSSTLIAYREITENGRGYCADYTQVFNGLAHALNVPVREWGMSFDRFGGDGHAFNEIWDKKKRQWIFIDPMNGFYVRDTESGRPLSALEFQDRLIADGDFSSMMIEPIGNAFRFDSQTDAFQYYRGAAERFFLWFGNDVFSYDRHPLVKTLGPISRSLEQMAAIVWGIHPRIRVLAASGNKEEIRDLLRLPYIVGILLLAAMVLTILIVAQCASLWHRRRGRTDRFA